jgi:Ca2+-binding EF-hand superfamily protein
VDTDGDGGVELHELKKFLRHLPKKDVETEFDKADRNRDGVLDRHEYGALVRHAVTQPHPSFPKSQHLHIPIIR